MKNRCFAQVILLTIMLATGGIAQAAELSIGSMSMAPDAVDVLVVSGHVDEEFTSGVMCMLEIVPREGNTGALVFTSAPPVDVVQLGDPWLGSGTFAAWDTDGTFSLAMNGSTRDSAMPPESLVFSGELSGFPIVASADAEGVWDVTLSTSVGDSSWEGIGTTLVAGTVRVVPEPSTLVLLAMGGLVALGWWRRRK
ncbi:MAG: PEP-CTERM sorting domain-containing protein [Candidatus Nealsonbacteria bacterium]|nr:PEP-CTERM sorting domain-containing protein [Candidatus Nealsonbacteria bacterium]